jgi:diacylglycerol kinase (ATP)
MRAIVLYNPISGRGIACQLAGEISKALLQAQVDVEFLPTEAGDPKQWLAPKLETKPDAVVAVGGDGTIRHVASALLDSGIPVYHAASGTENLFAKSMSMSSTPVDVIAAVLDGESSVIDTATANGSFMLLMASVGFDAEVVADLSNHRGASITHFSYVMPCIRQFLCWNPPVISIQVDGKDMVTQQRGWAVVANSNVYARGLNPARDADITDGLLDVVFLPVTGRLRFLQWVRRLRSGNHLQHPGALCLRGARVQVQTQSSAIWQIDGDPVGESTEMEVVCNAGSLRVLQKSIAVDDSASNSSD